jgi:hypothetical protein
VFKVSHPGGEETDPAEAEGGRSFRSGLSFRESLGFRSGLGEEFPLGNRDDEQRREEGYHAGAGSGKKQFFSIHSILLYIVFCYLGIFEETGSQGSDRLDLIDRICPV